MTTEKQTSRSLFARPIFHPSLSACVPNLKENGFLKRLKRNSLLNYSSSSSGLAQYAPNIIAQNKVKPRIF